MKMNRKRLLTEFDVGGDIANFHCLFCLYEMHRMTEYLARSGRIPCLITDLWKFKSYAEGQWKRGKRKGNVCQVINRAKEVVLVSFYDIKGRNQKYEINIHLENKMQPHPLAYRNLENNNKSVNSTGIYLCNSVDTLLPSVFSLQSTVLGYSRKDVGEVSVASCLLEAHNLTGKTAIKTWNKQKRIIKYTMQYSWTQHLTWQKVNIQTSVEWNWIETETSVVPIPSGEGQSMTLSRRVSQRR